MENSNIKKKKVVVVVVVVGVVVKYDNGTWLHGC